MHTHMANINEFGSKATIQFPDLINITCKMAGWSAGWSDD